MGLPAALLADVSSELSLDMNLFQEPRFSRRPATGRTGLREHATTCAALVADERTLNGLSRDYLRRGFNCRYHIGSMPLEANWNCPITHSENVLWDFVGNTVLGNWDCGLIDQY
jgi:hypothetical protein